MTMLPKPPRYALLSVTDKTGITSFAKELIRLGFTILSTGGTASLLRDHQIPVTDVGTFTGSPEALGGRVKTLHPMVHGGILADRFNDDHLKDMERMGWQNIDVVAVNLYNFSGEARDKNLPLAKAIEYVDVGGPTMLRAAAKNHCSVLPIVDPHDYDRVLAFLNGASEDIEFREYLAGKVFTATAAYDQMIAAYFIAKASTNVSRPASEECVLATGFTSRMQLLHGLRYGENSHQKAGVYMINGERKGLTAARILQGKELSYNNYVDLDAAAAIVADLSPLQAITIIKHTNPCGTAALQNATAHDLFVKALGADAKCAFGGIVASNIAIDAKAATAMAEIFLECVIAPEFTADALAVFATKKNLRVIASEVTTRRGRPEEWQQRSISGGLLVQTADLTVEDPAQWTCATLAKPTPEMLAEMRLAMTLCKHVKSNAIVVTREGASIGIGAGQMSRIDSARIAVEKARELGHSPCGAVAASDAFFPFRDSVDFLAKAGVSAIVQPGGSLRDQESIDAANEHGIVMMITGVRHFKH